MKKLTVDGVDPEGCPSIGNIFAALKEVVFGVVIVLFLIFEPDGLNHRWQMTKAYWKLWPFSY